VLKRGVCSSFIEHSFQSSSTRFYEIGVKSTHSLFLGRWRYNNTWVVRV
jgi:hypothetical protein